MPENGVGPEAGYFLGFDGGGTKTDCILAGADGRIVLILCSRACGSGYRSSIAFLRAPRRMTMAWE